MAGSNVSQKHKDAIRMITRVYENADINIVSMELTKIGILSHKLIR